MLADIIPSGVDREGNEVSFDVWSTLRSNDADTQHWGRSHEWKRSREKYLAWYESKTQDGRKNPYSRSRSFLLSQRETADMIEHIAGVNCSHGQGFNGNAISAEEMRLCNTSQYIVRKDNDDHRGLDLSPELDDEDFERDSNYLLSGLADRTDGVEGDCSCFPPRHGLGGDNDEMSPDEGGFDPGDLIFHPHCLEIYKRVAALRLGSAEPTHVPAFADWWDSDGRANFVPSHESVTRDQWYRHEPGCEFVVANPLQIPALAKIIEAAQRPQSDFDASKNSPFGAKETICTSSNHDIFWELPSELRDMVVSSLDSKDIANLRLASRAFGHLPITLWHDLLRKEVPWVWEAWSNRPYPFMSCTTRPELEARDQAMKERFQAMRRFGQEHKAKEKKLIVLEERRFRKPRAVQQLSRLKTDWHYLYCQLARERKNIKGLQNRERIWKTIEYIVRRITDPDENPDSAMKAHEKAFPFRGP